MKDFEVASSSGRGQEEPGKFMKQPFAFIWREWSTGSIFGVPFDAEAANMKIDYRFDCLCFRAPLFDRAIFDVGPVSECGEGRRFTSFRGNPTTSASFLDFRRCEKKSTSTRYGDLFVMLFAVRLMTS